MIPTLRSRSTLAQGMSQFKCREWWSTVSGYEEFHDIGSLATTTILGKSEFLCCFPAPVRVRLDFNMPPPLPPPSPCTSRASPCWKLSGLPSRICPKRGQVLPRPCRSGDRPWAPCAAGGRGASPTVRACADTVCACVCVCAPRVAYLRSEEVYAPSMVGAFTVNHFASPG